MKQEQFQLFAIASCQCHIQLYLFLLIIMAGEHFEICFAYVVVLEHGIELVDYRLQNVPE